MKVVGIKCCLQDVIYLLCIESKAPHEPWLLSRHPICSTSLSPTSNNVNVVGSGCGGSVTETLKKHAPISKRKRGKHFVIKT